MAGREEATALTSIVGWIVLVAVKCELKNDLFYWRFGVGED